MLSKSFRRADAASRPPAPLPIKIIEPAYFVSNSITFRVPAIFSGECLSIKRGSTTNSLSSAIAKCFITKPSDFTKSIAWGVIFEIPSILTSCILFDHPNISLANITIFPAASKPSISKVGSDSA